MGSEMCIRDRCSNELFNTAIVCFCDIPFPDLGLHISKYSPFGISFRRAFLLKAGANPVFYVAKDGCVRSVARGILWTGGNDVQVEADGPTGDSIARGEYFDRIISEYVRLQDMVMRSSREHFDKIRHTQRFFNYYILSFIKGFDAALSDEHKDNFYMEREWRLLGRLDFQVSDVYRIILPAAYSKRFREDLGTYAGQVSYAEVPEECDPRSF